MGAAGGSAPPVPSAAPGTRCGKPDGSACCSGAAEPNDGAASLPYEGASLPYEGAAVPNEEDGAVPNDGVPAVPNDGSASAGAG
ncbi:hypothetical protein [Actinoplanes octamycinicus]|uniref:hypothetical protein n=1 Tax=Actinoplanes octamycinicus TaxID=135948 RepID=UPI0035EBEEA7